MSEEYIYKGKRFSPHTLNKDDPGEPYIPFNQSESVMISNNKLSFLLQLHHPEKKIEMKKPEIAKPVYEKIEKIPLTLHDKARLIIKDVSKVYKVTTQEICGTGRTNRIMFARLMAIDSVKNRFPNLSLMQLAKIFNRKDHTFIYDALQRITKWKNIGTWPPKVS